MRKTIAVLSIAVMTAALIGSAIVPLRGQAAPLNAPTNPGTANLVAWWALDETSGTRNDSHSTNNLSDNNTVAYDTGVKSNAADFTRANSEYLSRADNAALSAGDIDFSVGAWVKLKSKDADSYFLAKVSTYYEYYLRYSSVADRFYFSVTDGSGNANTILAATFGSPSTDTWYFLSGRHDAANDRIYISVNAGTEDNKAHTFGSHDSNGAFYIGRNASSTYIDALIDEAYLYKKVLTTDEISWLYNAGVGRSYCEVAENCATATPTITETPTVTQTQTLTRTPTLTATITHTVTGTLPPTHTETPTATITETPTVTQTLTPTVTVTITRTPTVTATGTPPMATPALSNEITYGDLLSNVLLMTLIGLLAIGLVLYVTFNILLRKK